MIQALHAGEEISLGLWDILLDTLLDSLKILPFLFLAFVIMELLEHRANGRIERFFTRAGKAGPAAGALLGCVPQCGFSVLCANLYVGGVVTRGTLVAVFLSTSDEAVLLLAAAPQQLPALLKLLLCKVVIAVAAGYVVDFFGRRTRRQSIGSLHEICDHEHCGCEKHKGIWIPALLHTVKIFGFLLLFTFLLNFLVAWLGHERLETLLLHDSVLQPFAAALLGFLPNCAASVLLTQLYVEGTLGFGAVVAGLCTGAGAGLLVLFRENRHVKDNLKILGILYAVAAVSGVILQAAGM